MVIGSSLHSSCIPNAPSNWTYIIKIDFCTPQTNDGVKVIMWKKSGGLKSNYCPQSLHSTTNCQRLMCRINILKSIFSFKKQLSYSARHEFPKRAEIQRNIEEVSYHFSQYWLFQLWDSFWLSGNIWRSWLSE